MSPSAAPGPRDGAHAGWFGRFVRWGRSLRRRPSLQLNGRRYEDLRALRETANGTVFRARDESGREVALKRFDASFDDEDVEQFRLEYEALRALDGRGTVEALDFGIDVRSGLPFIVMALVDGEPLWRAAYDVGEAEIGSWFARLLQTCAGLRDAGFVHCDLKPDNILVAVDGRVLLTDFGAAVRMGERIKALSPGFLAPEHVADIDNAFVDDATDLFALGVSFYLLLTGAHPYYPGDEDAVLEPEHFETPPTPASALNRSINLVWDACLMGLVDVDPERRRACAAEILAGAIALPPEWRC